MRECFIFFMLQKIQGQTTQYKKVQDFLRHPVHGTKKTVLGKSLQSIQSTVDSISQTPWIQNFCSEI